MTAWIASLDWKGWRKWNITDFQMLGAKDNWSNYPAKKHMLSLMRKQGWLRNGSHGPQRIILKAWNLRAFVWWACKVSLKFLATTFYPPFTLFESEYSKLPYHLGRQKTNCFLSFIGPQMKWNCAQELHLMNYTQTIIRIWFRWHLRLAGCLISNEDFSELHEKMNGFYFSEGHKTFGNQDPDSGRPNSWLL